MQSATQALPSAREVVDFWRAAGRERWFRKDEAFDADFRNRFLAAHEAAAGGALDGWGGSAEGSLALLILLDQFPRNAFRGTARMYATDPKAREVARAAVAQGHHTAVDPELQGFFCLPFTHSEDSADHARSVELSRTLDEDTRRFTLHHRDLVQRFGRFPHRNALLGRATTVEEQRFLDEGGFSG
ncbi:DUF924 family protein [Ramlibacter sp.]|uniref:DUF924 family protein n=1 Tax=Ramlibacter sp. TaxID=1917967 RepID=UPI0017B7C63F|nr:DUF924 family protein [Ramlibacter sp.]MBA2673993.1 DUF924 family protein [Ramlibacter sp.]